MDHYTGQYASLSDRQRRLLDLLRDRGELAVAQIQEQLQVSQPTAYRDIRHLVDAGLADRTTGGLRLPHTAPVAGPSSACVQCGAAVPSRTAVIIQLSGAGGVTKGQVTACCPHCGLMALSARPDSVSGLAADFLYGRMVNVRQAAFLVESQVSLCCTPSVLCFSDAEDAVRFQRGFDGRVLDYPQALQAVRRAMQLTPPAQA